MAKNKLAKFADMEQFSCVFQCGAREIDPTNEVAQMAGHWRERYFHNDYPIVLELGCGHGEYTIGLARLNPNKNFIGIDIKGARMWAGARVAEQEKLTNVAFLRINIEMLTSFFAPNEVDEIWITFCDPQMKKATKRLTSTYFMTRYEQVMRTGGLIHLKTDSSFLYTYTREMLRLNDYCVEADTKDLYRSQKSDLCAVGSQTAVLSEVESQKSKEATMLQTHYEQQWLDRGLTIKYLCWHLDRREQKQEPTIEIEKDTYRSYGRNYTPQS